MFDRNWEYSKQDVREMFLFWIVMIGFILLFPFIVVYDYIKERSK